MRWGVIVFPGSCDEQDVHYCLKDVLGQKVDYLWHKDRLVGRWDCLVLPGGFSYGDYLRAGAMARFSPIMQGVIEFARKGGLVLGICNGFQILCEAGLLPGTLVRNTSLRFNCRHVFLRIEEKNTPFTCRGKKGMLLRLPIKHGDGCYYADPLTFERLRKERQIVLRYVDSKGKTSPSANPNGSLDHIAGICNETRNVFGLMPHPEDAVQAILGSEDGVKIFSSVMDACSRGEQNAWSD
ncbi:MAG: phosphoribosylformylglycinamidine synthase subunit PurQ [Deltaproteobacteria bacterium]|nr:phosphoribosylformylglycinamidine synthase subunit PurQ [Deltaproteobacteria bacterium]